MNQQKSPKMPFSPPLLYIGGFGVGWLIAQILPLDIVSGNFRVIGLVLSWILIAVGLLIMIIGLYSFAKARTSIIPNLTATQLLTTGPYGFSRNPLYAGWTLTYIGGALLTNIAWCMFTLVIVLVVFDKVIIPCEEEYLKVKFGESYQRYCKQVRRWL
jgi:protein-S-isoprenylcysteine O-methyltransferase Ste14